MNCEEVNNCIYWLFIHGELSARLHRCAKVFLNALDLPL